MSKKIEHDKELEQTREMQRQEFVENDIKQFVESFSETKGKERVVETSKWVVNGVFMGSSDAIPGYSGGTTLALIGFFKKLIIVAKSVFVPKYGITRIRAFIFLLPFLAGWMAGVFGIAKATEAMASHGMGLELLFFFSAFVVFAIPVYLRSIKVKGSAHKRKLSRRMKIGLFSIGLLIVVGLALSVLLWRGGAEFHGNDSKKDEKFDMSKWWYLAIVAYVAGMVTLIPGGSGAIIQLLAGMYDKIHWTIMANAQKNVGPLFIFAFFTFLGMVSMVFIMSWLFVKRERMLEVFSLGMLVASPAAILIVPEKVIWTNLEDWRHILGVISAALLGASLGYYINWYTKRKVAKQKTA